MDRNPRYSYPHGSMRSVESGFYPVYRTGPTYGDLYRATAAPGEDFMDWLRQLDDDLEVWLKKEWKDN